MYKWLLGDMGSKPPKIKADGLDKKFWEAVNHPGAYQADKKLEITFSPLFEWLKKRGIKIGKVVFDIGSGTEPMSKLLVGEGNNKREVFAIDFLPPAEEQDGIHHVDTDINLLTKRKSFTYRRKFLEICKILGLDPKGEQKEKVDAMIFSEILNYVPYRQIIPACLEFLKPGGIVIIYNMPGRTFDFAFNHLPDCGVKDNGEFLAFLKQEKFGLEFLLLEYSDEEDYITGQKMMLAVVRKK